MHSIKKHLAILAICIIGLGELEAQTFGKIYDINGARDSGRAVTVDEDGNVYIAASGICINTWLNGCLGLTRISAQGVQEWALISDDPIQNELPLYGDLHIVNDNIVLISQDTATDLSWQLGIRVYSSEGALIDSLSIGGTDKEKIRAATPTSDNGFLLVGRRGLPDDFPKRWMLKLNAEYETEWEIIFDDTYVSAFYSVIEMSDSTFTVSGYKSFNPDDGQIGCVVKVNPDGSLISETDLDINPNVALIPYPNDHFIHRSRDNSMDNQLYVSLVDQNLEEIWRIDHHPDYALSLKSAYDSSGDVYTIGWVVPQEILVDPLNFEYGTYGWMNKISSTGEELWNKRYAILESNFTDFYDLAIKNDTLYVAGSSAGYYASAEAEANNNNDQEVLLLKLDQDGCIEPGCTEEIIFISVSYDSLGTGIQELKQAFFKLSPNPAEDRTRVSFYNPVSRISPQLRLLDAMGRVVHQEALEPGSEQIFLDLAAFPSGMYFVQYLSQSKLLEQQQLFLR